MIRITPADRYFSLCVRKRANWRCQRCGRGYTPPTQALHCAHVFGRGAWSTRFDPENAVSLCMGDHLWFTAHPAEFMEWIQERLGIEKLTKLKARAKRPVPGLKSRLKAIAQHYRLEHDRMRLGGEFQGYEEAGR